MLHWNVKKQAQSPVVSQVKKYRILKSNICTTRLYLTLICYKNLFKTFIKVISIKPGYI